MTDDIPATPMPTFEQEQYIQDHAHAQRADEAHPIDEDVLHEVCDTKIGPAIIHYDLALVQAIAVREVLPYLAEPKGSSEEEDRRSTDNGDTESWIKRDGDLHYYRAQSVTFYDILSMAHQRYDHTYVEIEDAADLAEAHTRQYLKDVHGYEGDFGGQVPNESIDKIGHSEGAPEASSHSEDGRDGAKGSEIREPTLCNAQNDAHWLRDEEPEDAYYAFTDARGLVIEEGTHVE